MNDIDKIINQSSRQELIEFLEDKSFDLDSALILYHKSDREYGYRKLEGSDMSTLIGILRIIIKLFENIEAEALEEDILSEDEE